eukprot:scaffold5284_cov73-Skeletonema_dohrnii-CCMP3373.AAC.1
MINHLSPVEVSFIRRRVKQSIRAIVYNAEGSDGSGGSSGHGGSNHGGSASGRSSLTKKMGRLLGKEGNSGDKYSSSSSLYNNNGDSSDASHHTHPALLEDSNATVSTEGRIKVSKVIYQKERLIDITIMRKIFEGGDKCLRDMQLLIKSGRRSNINGVSSKSAASPLRQQHQYGENEDGTSILEDSERQQQHESLGKIDIYGSAYLLLIYMSETRWDYVTDIARHSAKRAGLTLDVNQLALQEAEREKKADGKRRKENGRRSTNNQQQRQSQLLNGSVSIPPLAPSPLTKSPSEVYNNSDLTTNEPGGVHFTSLCYLVALALRGTRRQKLNLLFHLLLPPKELDALLSSHPAGGLPTWLLEVDEDVIFSYDSLAYYYSYEGVMLPAEGHGWIGRNSKKSSGGKKKLCVDATSVVEILATILSGSAGSTTTVGEKETYGIRRLSDTMGSEGGRVAGDVSSPKQCQNNVSDLLSQEIGGGNESNLLSSKNEKKSLKGFIDKCNRVTSSSSAHTLWSMRDFVTWADAAIDETVLDKVMRNLFGTGIVPSAKLEHTIVTQRWINWNMQDEFEDVDTTRNRDDAVSPKTRFHKRIANDESHHSQESTNTNNWESVWGGIGGTDGKGGLGHGVLYCIEKSWWDDWVAYTGWKAAEGNVFNPTSLKRPRELSTERLIDRSVEAISMSGTRGSYELMKRKLSLGKHYVL